MSFNRLRYDNCAYKQELNESVGTLAYVLDPSRFKTVINVEWNWELLVVLMLVILKGI